MGIIIISSITWKYYGGLTASMIAIFLTIVAVAAAYWSFRDSVPNKMSEAAWHEKFALAFLMLMLLPIGPG